MEQSILQRHKKESRLLDYMLFNIFTPEVLQQIWADPKNNLSPRKDSAIQTTEKPIEKDLNYYINKVGERVGWKYEKIRNVLNILDSIYPVAAFSIIIREIAVDLDRKYPDHIEHSPEIYAVGILDGKIHLGDKRIITSYKNFAAFRTYKDASTACKILSPIMQEIFPGGQGN